MASGFMALPATGSAESKLSCASLVQECMAYRDGAREQCFRASANHSACLGTDLGELTTLRVALTPEEQFAPDAPGGGLAFLGPQAIDAACIEQFDLSLSSTLIAGTISSDSIKLLRQRLSQCETSAVLELPTP